MTPFSRKQLLYRPYYTGIRIGAADRTRPGSACRPERLSPPVLAAPCDILDCSPADLIEPYIEGDRRKRTAGEVAVIEIRSDLPPERASIIAD
ncbi:helix-turn-helix domain-containing protein [Streptomyces sp. NPDC056304]|uniref:helix-turn-helix domain-containing protein n=1 Tax=Streptomyces sp. NPDC056304 TaxID=3345778 RepID=UPI0035DD1123